MSEPVSSEDYMQYTKLENLSKSTTHILWVTKKAIGHISYGGAIYSFNLNNAKVEQLTDGDFKDRFPKMSVTGEVAFISDRDGRQSLYLLNEKDSLTPHWLKVIRHEWSFDGSKIALIGRIVPNSENMTEEELSNFHEEQVEPRIVTNLIYRTGTTFFNEWESDQCFILDLSSRKIQRISDLEYNYQGISWISNNKVVALTKLDKPADLSEYLDIVELDIGEEAIGHAIGRTYHPYVFEKPIQVNPHNPSLIGIQYYDPNYHTGKRYQKLKWKIYGSQTEQVLNQNLDRSLAIISWLDETSYHGIVYHHGFQEVRLGKLDDEGDNLSNQLYQPTFSAEEVVGISHDEFLCIGTSPNHPSSLYHFRNGEYSLIFNGNTWTSDKKISVPEVKWFENPEKQKFQGWFFNAGSNSPLILSIHGGPHIMWNNAGTMWLEWQSQVSAGYSILAMNPVGSDGYGEEFLRVIVGNWGRKDARDLLDALTKTTQEYEIDRERLYITGGSYAGFQTVNIIGQDSRFKAACSQRGVYNLLTLDAGGDLAKFEEIEYLGKYDGTKNIDKLWSDSPISKVHSINTPLLLIHSEQDYRVPIHQAEHLFLELRQRGLEIKFVRYPRNGHDLSRAGEPKFVIDRLNKMKEWFDEHP